MPFTPHDHDKPPILRHPRRLLQLGAALAALALLIYAATALTAFIRNQEKPTELRKPGSEAPLERAM